MDALADRPIGQWVALIYERHRSAAGAQRARTDHDHG
jgi:hypothetical protein